ncbi:hypothetical protein HD806DRAFT_532293 [Xylariaceae sp. AK1471]|nr:hypothetical protein HD806DRAFT_532293 [Xylariaceae sp. AK1471]
MTNQSLVGIIKVPLCAFTYEPEQGRAESPAIVKRLSDLFRKTRCRPSLWENHVKGRITSQTLEGILATLNFTQEQLHSTIYQGDYPLVHLKKEIICLDGRHRLAAARKVFGDKVWWPVKLYSTPLGPSSFHQTTYADGEIYRSLRLCQRANQDLLAREWMVQLSPSKQAILRLLFKNTEIVEALDRLLPFPGVWDGLRIGNIHKYLALHFDEQLLHYFGVIHAVWLKITEEISPVDVDSGSVRCLEARAPSIRADRKFIQHMFDHNRIFRSVADPGVRARLLQTILSFDSFIPSMGTFEKWMKYFALGARTLGRELLGDGEKADRHVSVFERLEWQSPTTPTVEVAEGVFQTSTIATKGTAFQELFLFAVRHFPFLCDQSPRQDVKGEGFTAGRSDLFCLHLFARAKHMGFTSNKIDEMALRLSELPTLGIDSVQTSRRATTWRYGKPSVSTFLELRSVAFIPTLDAIEKTSTLTPGFALKHFMGAFFGVPEYMLDMVDPPNELRRPSHNIPMTDPRPPLRSFNWDTIQVDLQPTSSNLVDRSHANSRGVRKRVKKGRETRKKPMDHIDRAAAQDSLALRELELQVPDRLARRSPVSITAPGEQAMAGLVESAARLSPAQNVGLGSFRPGVALPQHNPPEPVTFMEPGIFDAPEGSGVKPKNYLTKPYKEKKKPGKLQKKTPRERLSSSRAQPKPNLSNFTFRSRKEPALSPSALERTETSPIFSLEDRNARTTRLKRTHADSLAEGLQVDIRPSQTLSQRKRRRSRGPLVKAGTKRTASQSRGDWFSTAIRRKPSQGTIKRPKLSPELDDGYASTTPEQDREAFSGRREASPSRGSNREQGQGAGATKEVQTEMAVAQGDSSSRVLRRDNEPASRASSIKQVVDRRSPINEPESFAETRTDFPLDEDWATDTEIPDSDRERSAPESPDDSSVL